MSSRLTLAVEAASGGGDLESLAALAVLVFIPVAIVLAVILRRIWRRTRPLDEDALVAQLGRNMSPQQQAELRESLRRDRR
jgi:uncharacterized membrane protein YoaK (UPF0700 family)